MVLSECLFYPTLPFHLFVHKVIYFFECLYFSKYDIRMYLYVFWLRKVSSVKCVRNWWGDWGGRPKCIKLRIGRERVPPHVFSCPIFSCFWQHFCLILSCFICRNLTLPLIKKDVFIRNGYFSPTR